MQCLVIMPFGAEFDPVFRAVRDAVATAVPGRPIDCYWLKDVHAAGRITDDLVAGIQKAALCVADLTGCNPNVMWETGYAMALGKPTVLVSQDVEALPFDLKVHRVLAYRPDQLDALAATLAKAVAQTLSRYAVDLAVAAVPTAVPAIAVTGSSMASPARARRRVETLLGPYLPAKPVWYTGTIGTVDEAAIRFLLENGQRVVTVGYHGLDYSAEVLQLIRERKVAFLDATVETIPRGLVGPSERDVLFASRAELVVLFWDGASLGTAHLIDFFRANGTNLLVGHV